MSQKALGFIAQLKSVRHNVVASGDNEYTVILRTSDARVLELGKHNPQKTVGVAITTEIDYDISKLKDDAGITEDNRETLDDMKKELFRD